MVSVGQGLVTIVNISSIYFIHLCASYQCQTLITHTRREYHPHVPVMAAPPSHAVSRPGWEDALIRVQRCGLDLRSMRADLQADATIVRAAVEQSGWALRYACVRLQADPGTVRAAVQCAGCALRYAHAHLRADPDIVRAAVGQSGIALLEADERLQVDAAIVRAAVEQSGWVLQLVREPFRADPAIVQAAVNQAPAALRFAAEAMQHDMKVLALFVRAAGPDYLFQQHLPVALRLRANKAVVCIEAWLEEWRCMETVLMAMAQEGGAGGAKRRREGGGHPVAAARCLLGALDLGDGVIARRVGEYLRPPGRFVGVSGLRVVDVCERVTSWSRPSAYDVAAVERGLYAYAAPSDSGGESEQEGEVDGP